MFKKTGPKPFSSEQGGRIALQSLLLIFGLILRLI